MQKCIKLNACNQSLDTFCHKVPMQQMRGEAISFNYLDYCRQTTVDCKLMVLHPFLNACRALRVETVLSLS